MNKRSNLNLPSLSFNQNENSVSILSSKREVEAILNQGNQNDNLIQKDFILNRQVTSGMIIDWKHKNKKQDQGYLILKNGEKQQKIIYQLFIEQWISAQTARVIYKWIRIPTNKNGYSGLAEEEHMYRGRMKNKRKDGQGQYLIIKRYYDDREQVSSIHGNWENDILINGTMIDKNGKQRSINRNIMIYKPRTRCLIEPNLNETIEVNQKKLSVIGKNQGLRSSKLVDSKESVLSIIQKIAEKHSSSFQ